MYDISTITATANNFILTGTGKNHISLGWKTDKIENDDIQCFVPPKQGETHFIEKCILHEKMTQPQKHYTESTLLTLMENPKGETGNKLASLGTPATRAGIIDTLLQRKYIELVKRNLIITDKGKFLINTVITIPELRSFISLSTTTKWEERLESEPEQFVTGIKQFLTDTIPVIKELQQGKWENPSIGLCPICKKGKIREGKKNWFCSRYTEGCQFVIRKDISSAKITETDIKNLIEGKKTKQKKFKSQQKGKEFTAALRLNNEGKPEFVFSKNN